jgi:Glycosyltransferase family 29 (sialyltransferase)
VTENEWLASLAGRTVALVGAAASGAGTGLGAQIDAHDVVVRVNWACPVPRGLKRDLGARTNTLYHGLRYGLRHVRGDAVDGWRRAGVGLVIGVTHPRKARARNVEHLCQVRGIPFFCAPRLAAHTSRATGTGANKGICALYHLLSSDLARLSLYAFDFYRTGHWLGQRNETPAQAAAQAGIDLGHDQAKQRAWVRATAIADRRLVLLPHIRAMLDLDSGDEGAA